MILTVRAEHENMRVDAFLAAQSELSRTAAGRLCEEGMVKKNGRFAGKSDRVAEGDVLEFEQPAPVELDVRAEDIPLDIVYEDGDLLVVNKPKGMVVHPAAGNPDGTLVNALMAHCRGSLSGINGVIRPGIVHRIDKDTSGLLIVAKTDKAHLSLAAQIKEHSFTRRYEAVLCGRLREGRFTVDAPIGRSEKDRKKMAVTPRNSRHAVTHFSLIGQYEKYAHVGVTLETGRTHQIRVHSAYIGHPVAGDTVYGAKKPLAGLEGQCLHAKLIGFVHPATGQYMEFDSELPDYFRTFLASLQKNG